MPGMEHWETHGTHGLFDFFVRAGWIKAAVAATTVAHKKSDVQPVRLAKTHAAQGTLAHGQPSDPRASRALATDAGPGLMVAVVKIPPPR